jgi:hypothetical protein
MVHCGVPFMVEINYKNINSLLVEYQSPLEIFNIQTKSRIKEIQEQLISL